MTQPNLFQSVKSFIDNLAAKGGKPLYELTPQEARRVLLDTQKSTALPEIKAEIKEISIPLDKHRQMKVIIARPLQYRGRLPIIFYIHGGGWVMGDEVTHNRLIRKLANDVSAAVVFPVYTQSPEAQYPQTTNDLFFVLQHIVQHAEEYELDGERLAVAGDSVGGNMAAVMTLMAKRNNNIPNILLQVLLYPVTDANFDTESYQKFAEGPWLTKKAMQWFWQQYAPRAESRREIFASPLQASVVDLEELPPAVVITDENDVLRDEGEAYARKLDQAGVVVSAIRINGTIHDFLMLNALAETEQTHEAFQIAVRALKDALG